MYRTGMPRGRRARRQNVNSVSSSQLKVQPNIENRTGTVLWTTPGFELRIPLTGWVTLGKLLLFLRLS